MPCASSMFTEVIKAKPDNTVEDLLNLVREHNIRAVPIVNDANVLVGMFSMHQLLRYLLPISVTMERGLDNIDFIMRASPEVAKKLKETLPRQVADIMDRNLVSVHPETPTLEAIRIVVKYGSPVPVVEKGTNVLVGLISEQSLVQKHFKVLDKLKSVE